LGIYILGTYILGTYILGIYILGTFILGTYIFSRNLVPYLLILEDSRLLGYDPVPLDYLPLEDGDTKFIRNMGDHSTKDTESCLRIPDPLETLLSELQLSGSFHFHTQNGANQLAVDV
jgi:hypothetical protein